MAKVLTLDELIANVEKAKQAVDKATEALDAGLAGAELGFVFAVDGVPYQVSENEEGKRKAVCMMTKRAIAFMKGEPLPPVTRGRPRRGTAPAETKAAE